MSAIIPVSSRMNQTHIAPSEKFRINRSELFDREHTGQRNYTALVYGRIPTIFLGGDDVGILLAILISAQQSPIRIQAAIQRFYF